MLTGNSLVFMLMIVLAAMLMGLVFLLFRGSKTRSSRILIVDILIFLVWSVLNYIAGLHEQDAGLSLWANRAVFALGAILSAQTLWFVISVSYGDHSDKLSSKNRYLIFIPAFIAAIVSLTPYVVAGTYDVNGTTGIHFGPITVVYMLILLLILLAIIVVLTKAYISNRDKNLFHGTLLLSLAITIVLVSVSNILLPLKFAEYGLTTAGPLVGWLVFSAVAYSIVRHGFLDVKLTAVRTVAYAMTLSSLGGVYYGLAYLASSILFRGQVAEDVSSSPVNIALALFLAVIFQPIKKFFDTVTNHIFYRHDYDPQEMLDKVGNIVAKQIHTRPLLTDTLDIIKHSIKPVSAKFILVDSHGDKEYTRGFGEMKVSHDTVLSLTGAQQALFLVDALDQEFEVLQKQLQERNVSLVAQLDTTNGTSGYLLLGEKKNGIAYGRRDMDFISVMTDELAVAIENAQRYEEIQAFSRTLQEKVEEATSELQSTNHKLQALDKTKDDFIAMASHQLRTPLTTIKGYVSMLLDGDAGDLQPSQRRLLEETFNSSQRMVYIIGDLLNVSRIQTGKFQLEYSDVDLASVLEEEIQLVKISAIPRRITLDYDRPQNIPIIQLDEGKIRQVMMNFIDNAIYYSPMNSKIKILLQAIGSEIEFRVVDEGIGVPKNEQHKLFVKFARATNARKQRPDGTGIGLFMAKKVVVALGGSIIFESVEGKGSTFGFRIPIK